MSECPHPYGTCHCADRERTPPAPYAIAEHATLDAKAAERGEPCLYAWDACEDSAYYSGPCSTVADALAEFLDEHDVEDDHHVEVTLARVAGFPEVGDIDERLADDAHEDFGEHAGDALNDAIGLNGKALNAAVNAAIRAWFEANGGNPLAGYWTPYGKWLQTTAGDAREWLKTLEAKEEAEVERIARSAWA